MKPESWCIYTVFTEMYFLKPAPSALGEYRIFVLFHGQSRRLLQLGSSGLKKVWSHAEYVPVSNCDSDEIQR